ncbi:MAG: Gfo/Idh/MocA family oxidoreductase [Clostridia bacterium]|nr:Gfo/Idh/MocA family oxidoreductase [Clostridia bacterium]
MQKKKVIVIGCGSRGKTYTDIMKSNFKDDFEVVACAEPIADRRNYIQKTHSIPHDMCFESWEPIFEREKFADLVIIATMDRDHLAPAMAAIEKGYNLLLEKPVAATPEECRMIQKAAEKKGVFVLVCHVLRYTRFFIALKNIIDSGEIGKVMNIQAIESVGDVHQTHSFVRGNWGNSEKSSCMILQKTCHDMDILAWLIGKKCTEVHSFGSLSYFKKENAPKGSPEYCYEGCPVGDSCPYNAEKVYVDMKYGGEGWLDFVATEKVFPTKDDCINAIKNSPYGRCVFKCDNNVVDHQTVNLKFGDDVYVDFAMSAFTEGGRVLRIMGTQGEINAKMNGDQIEIFNFLTRNTRNYDFDSAATDEAITGGHGGGDTGIIYALRDLMNGKVSNSVCEIGESCDNHMISFAAEESRLTGKAINIKEFEERFR